MEYFKNKEALAESFPSSDPPGWTLGLEAELAPPQIDSKVIYTIGHSTRPISEFLTMLKNFDITQLIDVRTIPHSRYNPQYNQIALIRELSHEHIQYVHMPGLGGLRKPKDKSINQGLRNSSFRGYADYMQTISFEENLQKLILNATEKKTVIMCAEAVPGRCHRSLIADALISRGWKVINIMDTHHETSHVIHQMAKINEGRIYYPPNS